MAASAVVIASHAANKPALGEGSAFNADAVKAPRDSSPSVEQTQKKMTLKSGTVIILGKRSDDVLLADGSSATKSSKTKTPKSGSGEPNESVLNLPLAASPKKLVQTQEVPGIGAIPGSAADYQIKSVRVGTDRNELIYVSLQQLNKISTPYEAASVVDTSGATLKAIGQDIFIRPVNETPLTIYVSDGGTGQSIGLTLVPKANLPAQSIVLVPDRPVTTGAAASASAPEMVLPDYTNRLISLTKTLGSGVLPQGYTKSRLPRALANDGKAIFEPQYKYIGAVYDIYSYKIKSITPEPVELNEESFYTPSVRAVAFYPKTMLQQDEDTTVFVVVDRDAIGAKQ